MGVTRLGFEGRIGASWQSRLERKGAMEMRRRAAAERSKQGIKDVVSCVFLQLTLAAAGRTVHWALR